MTSDAWARVAEGSSIQETEFDTLFLSHYQSVYRLLFRIVGSSDEAEDLTQETFLRLYRQRFASDREHHVRGWLFRVATNLAYNALRRRRREEHREDAVAAREPLDLPRDSDPEHYAAQKEERDEVRRALATLPNRQAQLLLWRHAGLSYRELASALHVAPSSVGTLLARAAAAFEAAYGRQSPLAETGEGDEL